MIRPTVSATHSFCNPDILSVPSPDDDIVDQMPVLGTGMHPRSPVTGREAEDCIGDQKVMCCTSFQQ